MNFIYIIPYFNIIFQIGINSNDKMYTASNYVANNVFNDMATRSPFQNRISLAISKYQTVPLYSNYREILRHLVGRFNDMTKSIKGPFTVVIVILLTHLGQVWPTSPTFINGKRTLLYIISPVRKQWRYCRFALSHWYLGWGNCWWTRLLRSPSLVALEI